MKEYTDLELQLWLATQLKEEIESRGTTPYILFVWTHKYRGIGRALQQVTPNEWDYIVRSAEEKLTDEQYERYTELRAVELNKLFPDDRVVSTGKALRLTCSPSWQTRTKALIQLHEPTNQ